MKSWFLPGDIASTSAQSERLRTSLTRGPSSVLFACDWSKRLLPLTRLARSQRASCGQRIVGGREDAAISSLAFVTGKGDSRALREMSN